MPDEMSPSTSESRHFVFEQLADGVFAAIERDGGWAISNAGIVDLGGLTVVYAPSLSPPARIVSTNRTRELVLTDGQVELQSCVAEASDRLISLKEQDAAAATQDERNALSLWIAYWEVWYRNCLT